MITFRDAPGLFCNASWSFEALLDVCMPPTYLASLRLTVFFSVSKPVGLVSVCASHCLHASCCLQTGRPGECLCLTLSPRLLLSPPHRLPVPVARCLDLRLPVFVPLGVSTARASPRLLQLPGVYTPLGVVMPFGVSTPLGVCTPLRVSTPILPDVTSGKYN